MINALGEGCGSSKMKTKAIAIGDEVELFCPIPCDHLEKLSRGTVVHCYPSGDVFEVRFSGGRIVTVTRTEITEH
jgi:hypothetical protein